MQWLIREYMHWAYGVRRSQGRAENAENGRMAVKNENAECRNGIGKTTNEPHVIQRYPIQLSSLAAPPLLKIWLQSWAFPCYGFRKVSYTNLKELQIIDTAEFAFDSV